MKKHFCTHWLWFRSVAIAVVCLFCVNTVSYAITGRVISTDGNTLQVQSGFNPITDPSIYHEFLITAAIEGAVKQFRGIEKINFPLWVTINGIQYDLRFDSKGEDENTKHVVVPCAFSYGAYRWDYEAVVRPDMSVSLRKSGEKERSALSSIGGGGSIVPQVKRGADMPGPAEIRRGRAVKRLTGELRSAKTLKEMIDILDRLGDLNALDEEAERVLLERVIEHNSDEQGNIKIFDVQHYYKKIKALARHNDKINVPGAIERIPLPGLVKGVNRKGIVLSPDREKGQLAVLNPGVLEIDGQRYIFPRVHRKNANEGDGIKEYSVIGLDIFDEDGKHTDSIGSCLDPQKDLYDAEGNKLFQSDERRYGAEDIRIIRIGDDIYAFFTMVVMKKRGVLANGEPEPEQAWWNRWGIYSAAARISVNDLKNRNFHWEYLPDASLFEKWPDDKTAKEMGVDKEKICAKNGLYTGIQLSNGEYLALTCTFWPDEDPLKVGRGNVYWARAKTLEGPYNVLGEAWRPRNTPDTQGLNFDPAFVRTAGPLVKTEIGYINIYHAGSETPDGKIYRLGIMVHDLNDPGKIIYRSWLPVLIPEKDYELEGWVDNVVYSCGFIPVLKENKLSIYYGAADRHIAVAELEFADNWRELDAKKLSDMEEAELSGIKGAARSLRDTVPEEARSFTEKELSLLGNLTNYDGLSKDLVGAICSILLSGKKLVLAFDSKMGKWQSGYLREVLEEINDLKKDPEFESLLKNFILVTGSPEKMDVALRDHLGKENVEIFMFARASERQALEKIESQLHPVYIDEQKFPDHYAYYPLIEIVAMTLMDFLRPGILKKAGPILRKINIESVHKDMGAWIFTLPKAERYEKQELIRKYAALKRFLKAV